MRKLAVVLTLLSGLLLAGTASSATLSSASASRGTGPQANASLLASSDDPTPEPSTAPTSDTPSDPTSDPPSTAPSGTPVLRLVRVNDLQPGTSTLRAVYENASVKVSVQGKNTTVAVRTRRGSGDWTVMAETALQQTSSPAYAVPLQTVKLTAPAYDGANGWDVQVGWLDSSGTWQWGAVTSFAVIKPAVRTPATASHRWETLSGTESSRWNPCQVITYKVSVQGARGSKAKAMAQIRSSLAYIGHATGLRFRYAGTTKVSAKGKATSSADITVVIGHFTNKRVGGNTMVWWKTVNGADFYLIDRAKIRLETNYDQPRYRSEYVRHEMLHALGLGHSHNRGDIMYPQATGRTTLGWGDRVGISTVGRTAGCVTP